MNDVIFYTATLKIYTTFDLTPLHEYRKSLLVRQRELFQTDFESERENFPYLNNIMNTNVRATSMEEEEFLQEPHYYVRKNFPYQIFIENDINLRIKNIQNSSKIDPAEYYRDVIKEIRDVMYFAEIGLVHSKLFSGKKLSDLQSRVTYSTDLDMLPLLTGYDQKDETLRITRCSLIQVSKVVYNDMVTMIIEVPYYKNNRWRIYKPHALPAYMNIGKIISHRISSSEEYIGTDELETNVITLSPAKYYSLKKCNNVYYIQDVVKTQTARTCEAALLLNEENPKCKTLVETNITRGEIVQTRSGIIVSVPRPTNLTMQCIQKSEVYEIKGIVIVQMNPICQATIFNQTFSGTTIKGNLRIPTYNLEFSDADLQQLTETLPIHIKPTTNKPSSVKLSGEDKQKTKINIIIITILTSAVTTTILLYLIIKTSVLHLVNQLPLDIHYITTTVNQEIDQQETDARIELVGGPEREKMIPDDTRIIEI